MIALAAALLANLPSLQVPEAPKPQEQPSPQQGESPGTPMPVPRAVVDRRGDRRIDIDGSLLDWPKSPPLELVDARQLSGTTLGAWRGPSDLSAFVFMLWDETDLYVGASVQDDWHRELAPGGQGLTEIPVCDSLVLTFDPNRDTRAIGPDPGRSEDRVFWIAEETSHKLLQWDVLRGTAHELDSGRQVVSHDKEKGLTTYEARIPWREILPSGTAVKAGLVFDLQVVVNDYDEVTDPMPQTRVGWTFGCGPRVDPGLFGSVKLVDNAAALDRLPEFPPRPEPRTQLPGFEHWRDLLAALAAHGPVLHDGSKAPAEVGGIERLRALEQLEDQCERFPRVDWLELHHRINRRMLREVAGIEASGLPLFWAGALRSVADRAAAEPPELGMRIFHLPMGGWVVRTKQRNFAVDPADNGAASMLWGAMEFVLITQPLDMTRRNDQLLVRMASAKPPRPYLTHIVFHLPLLTMADLSVVEPGKSYPLASGTNVTALGTKAADGSVPFSMAYRVELPNGQKLLFVGPSTEVADLPADPVTAMILSARNPHAAEIAAHVPCKVVLIDDQLLPETYPRVARLRLRDAFALQQAILPKPSVLLGPGESWDLQGK